MVVSRSRDLEHPAPSIGPGVRRALTGTRPGRALLAGVALKLAVVALAALAGPSPAISVLDTVVSLLTAAAGVALLVQQIAIARHRVLWRVRRKLIISYLFIGFVPVVLIIA